MLKKKYTNHNLFNKLITNNFIILHINNLETKNYLLLKTTLHKQNLSILNIKNKSLIALAKKTPFKELFEKTFTGTTHIIILNKTLQYSLLNITNFNIITAVYKNNILYKSDLFELLKLNKNKPLHVLKTKKIIQTNLQTTYKYLFEKKNTLKTELQKPQLTLYNNIFFIGKKLETSNVT
jgi:hypothetical protein